MSVGPQNEAQNDFGDRFRIISELISDYAFSYRAMGGGRYELEWKTGAFEQITGYAIDLSWTQDQWRELMHPEDYPRLIDMLHAVEANHAVAGEMRMVTREGAVRWIRLHAKPIWDDQKDRLKRIVGAVQDVTPYHRVQEALRRSEQQLRTLFDATPLSVVVVERDLRVVAWNRTSERTFGWRAEEVIGAKLPTPLPEYREKMIEVVRQTLEGRPVVEMDLPRQCRDGRRIEAETWTAVVPNERGEPDQVVLLTADVTGRRRAEEDLRRSEERFRTLFAAARDPLMVYRIDEHLTPGPFLEVNPATEHRFGYTREELLSMPASNLLSERSRSSFAEVLPTLQEQGSLLVETEMATKEGEPVPVEIHSHMVTLTGEPAVLAVVRDVSSRKEAEERLRSFNETLEQQVSERTAVAEQRAAQLRKLAAELGQAEQRERKRLAQVLHDHLQQILVAARLRMMTVQTKSLPEHIAKTLGQVSDLLSQSLETSRSLSVELAPPVLYDMGLNAAIEWLARWNLEQHNLEVHLDLDRSAEPEAEEVQVLLFQAVRELLFNVVKHASVREAWVTSSSAGSEQVRIRVEDRGSGFEQVELEPDQRGGLGLFAVQERLQFLGGRVEIHSEPGVGTMVELLAPRRALGAAGETAAQRLRPPAMDGAAAGAEPGAGGPVRVLLVDDHRVVREGLAGLLRDEADIEVIGEATDGAEAVEATRGLRPDVVVMDVSLPGMSGVEATGHITAQFPSVQVVGLSIHEERDMAAAMQNAGACAYLSKSGPFDDLLATIRRCGALHPSGHAQA